LKCYIINGQEEIYILSSLPANKMLGPDEIGHKLIEYMLPFIYLGTWISALHESIYPNIWKFAKVMSLFGKKVTNFTV
jgi:hypothetical protein